VEDDLDSETGGFDTNWTSGGGVFYAFWNHNIRGRYSDRAQN